jgi:lipopolysaccharide export LptBFGC system permease protein LptF
MGELGLVPPWLAAWMPAGVFAGIAMALMLRTETLS